VLQQKGGRIASPFLSTTSRLAWSRVAINPLSAICFAKASPFCFWFDRWGFWGYIVCGYIYCEYMIYIWIWLLEYIYIMDISMWIWVSIRMWIVESIFEYGFTYIYIFPTSNRKSIQVNKKGKEYLPVYPWSLRSCSYRVVLLTINTSFPTRSRGCSENGCSSSCLIVSSTFFSTWVKYRRVFGVPLVFFVATIDYTYSS